MTEVLSILRGYNEVFFSKAEMMRIGFEKELKLNLNFRNA